MCGTRLQEIVDFLGDHVTSICGVWRDIEINGIASISQSGEDRLDWVNPSRQDKQKLAEASKSIALIVDDSITSTKRMEISGKILIRVASPRYVVGLVGEHFFLKSFAPGVHKSAVVSNHAAIQESAYVGAHTRIGDCVIGRNSVIHDSVTISDSVIIGDNTQIFPGAVLGTDGLGCTRDSYGRLSVFPHLGRLIIGNDVIIGANCSIAKGSLSDTIIGEGTKINALCFIAHNCVIGKNVLITGSSMLNGSVRIGDNASIYSHVIVRDQKSVGDWSVIGMGSVVTKDVPPNEVWVGNPARFLRKNDK